MTVRPNVLVLMADQMQGRVLESESPCITPNLDALAARGVRVRHGYTANPVCSPARASMMTGLLPHNHGVEHVTHCEPADTNRLREEKPHWAQRLKGAGYSTGYFGKWHVETGGDLDRFGWSVNGEPSGAIYKEHAERARNGEKVKPEMKIRREFDGPPGYRKSLFYGVYDKQPADRGMRIATDAALEFLAGAVKKKDPWCCFVSFQEPHDPFVACEPYFSRYTPAKLPVPANWTDDLKDKPGLYRKATATFAGLTQEEKLIAMACYYASITEIDEQFGRVIDMLTQEGQLDNTIVVVTADHGELLGAHGLYMKNVGAFEEVYNIPMLLSGPGIARGAAPDARVGLHDLAPTLLDLAGLEPIGEPDSRSFASLLRDPGGAGDFQTGFAEYEGTRFQFTQRVIWDGNWKLVMNGFDFDELYDLETDPGELTNLALRPEHAEKLKSMFVQAWRVIRETGDATLLNSQYPALRIYPYGPDTKGYV